MSEVWYLTMADLEVIAEDAIGNHLIRDAGLLASALERPQITIFGLEVYTTLWHKAAALMHSIIWNHPFVDGNKRTGLHAALVFLGVNGIDVIHIDEDAAFNLVISVATAKLDEVGDIANALRLLVT